MKESQTLSGFHGFFCFLATYLVSSFAHGSPDRPFPLRKPYDIKEQGIVDSDHGVLDIYLVLHDSDLHGKINVRANIINTITKNTYKEIIGKVR